MMWTCMLCGVGVEGGVDEILEHVRVVHPGTFREVERWPDGGAVIHDKLL
jgi:hypothetical protein